LAFPIESESFSCFRSCDFAPPLSPERTFLFLRQFRLLSPLFNVPAAVYDEAACLPPLFSCKAFFTTAVAEVFSPPFPLTKSFLITPPHRPSTSVLVVRPPPDQSFRLRFYLGFASKNGLAHRVLSRNRSFMLFFLRENAGPVPPFFFPSLKDCSFSSFFWGSYPSGTHHDALWALFGLESSRPPALRFPPFMWKKRLCSHCPDVRSSPLVLVCPPFCRLQDIAPFPDSTASFISS